MATKLPELEDDGWDEAAYQPNAAQHIGGRKPLPDHQKRKRRVLWLTDAEWSKAEKLILEKIYADRHKESK